MRVLFVVAALVGIIAANYFVDEHVDVHSLNADSSFERIHYSVAAAKAAGKDASVSDAVLSKLSKAEGAEDIYHAVVTLSLLEKTNELAAYTDTLLAAVGQPFENAGYALEAISVVGGGVSEGQKASLAAKVAKLLRAAYISHDELSASFGDVDTTARIVTSLGSLSHSLNVGFPIGKGELVQFATYLSETHPADAEEKYYTDAALRFLAENDFYRPLLFRVRNDAVALGGDGTIVVSVTDALGHSGPALKVTASKITTDDKPDTPIVRGVELSKVSDTDYSFNLLSDEKIEQGFYIVDFDVEILEEHTKYINVEDVSELVKVTAPVELSDCQLSVSDSREEADTTASRTYPCHTGRSAGSITADQSQNIHLSFKISSNGKPAKPHQVFLRLENADHEDAIFVAKASADGRHALHANLGEAAEIFDFESGNYVATVLVGDALLPKAVGWEVATFTLKFSAPTARDDATDPYALRKEIHHEFRKPEKRAPEAVSLVFTALTAAPLLFLVIALGRLGVNISDFPSGTAGLYATVFHASIVGIAGLYTCYWLKLNMFTTLGYLGLLGVIAFFTGQKFLSWKAHQRSHAKTE